MGFGLIERKKIAGAEETDSLGVAEFVFCRKFYRKLKLNKQQFLRI